MSAIGVKPLSISELSLLLVLLLMMILFVGDAATAVS